MMVTFFPTGQLYDGYDEEYQCPILDEDRVSSISYPNFEPGSDNLICAAQKTWNHSAPLLCVVVELAEHGFPVVFLKSGSPGILIPHYVIMKQVVVTRFSQILDSL